MSKIEEALKKARAKDAAGATTRGTSADRRLVSAPQHEVRVTEGGVATSHTIKNMVEPRSLTRESLDSNRIIYPEMADIRVTNAFRQIRTRLVQQTAGKPPPLIMVTSVAPGSGGSFIALNLAVAFSFDESKTALLIDCNLREPSFNYLVKPEDGYGLTDYLEATKPEVERIMHSVGIQRFRLVPAGRTREIPSEYFTSRRLRQFLEDVRSRYRDRYVILDAPPITESADTSILSELCDHVLLVVPYRKVTEAQVINAAKAIGEHKLLGIIYNNEPRLPKLSWVDLLKWPLTSLFARFGGMPAKAGKA